MSGASGSPVSDSIDVSDELVIDEEVGGELDEVEVDVEGSLSGSTTPISLIPSVETFALYSAVFYNLGRN